MVFDIIEHLQIRPELKESILEFRKQYPVEPQFQSRIPVPSNIYYGTDIWEKAVTALLCGKNILAENLAYIFNRPAYNVSFHVNTNSGDLIGTDTFVDNEVKLRKGTIYQCAEYGGFGILDEINMAKSEALAVLHGTLDFRRSIDVPGYERIDLHPATRFIATMNYGYAGTKELNEALVSRFVVIRMPMISQEHLILLLQDHYPTLKTEGAKELAAVYLDLQKKCENAQISSCAMDLRGLLDGVALMEKGLNVQDALDMGITNKTFDPYEQTLIQDTIRGRISKKMKPEDLFEEKCGSCRKEFA